MSRRRSLLNTFLSLTGTHAAMAAFSFATTILLANSLGAEVFGQYSYAIAIGGYVFTITMVGMEQTQVRDLVQFPGRSSEFVSGGFILVAIMLLIASLGLLLTNVVLTADNRMSMVGVVLAIVIGAKALDLRSFYDASDRMKLHVSFLTIERFLYLAAVWLVFLFYRSELSIRTLAILLTVSTVAAAIAITAAAAAAPGVCRKRDERPLDGCVPPGGGKLVEGDSPG